MYLKSPQIQSKGTLKDINCKAENRCPKKKKKKNPRCRVTSGVLAGSNSRLLGWGWGSVLQSTDWCQLPTGVGAGEPHTPVPSTPTTQTQWTSHKKKNPKICIIAECKKQ
jgi:hypothetical protein